MSQVDDWRRRFSSNLGSSTLSEWSPGEFDCGDENNGGDKGGENYISNLNGRLGQGMSRETVLEEVIMIQFDNPAIMF